MRVQLEEMMNFKTLCAYLWKLPLCGLAFFIGLAIGGMLLPMTGLQSPKIPEGTEANMVAMWFLMRSVILAFVLSFVAGNLQAKLLIRWAILAELIWIFAIVGMVIESYFFMTTGAVASLGDALYTIMNFLLPALFLSLMLALLFRPSQPLEPAMYYLRDYFKSYNPGMLGWRVLLALAAYPLVYITFGLIVQPFIQDFYISGQFELAIPTWSQLIPLQLVRSTFFLIFSLPVIIWWKGTQRGLWLSLGFSIFVLTAFMAVITAYWFPWQLRFFHGLELLADALLYAAVLVTLFGTWQKFYLPNKVWFAGDKI